MNTASNNYQSDIIKKLGWDSFFQEHFRVFQKPDSIPARVISESKNSFQIYSHFGEMTATVSGKMHYSTGDEKPYPVVGDWVVVTPLVNENKAIIHDVLPRKNKFSRKAAGERTEEQVISANIDTVFIVCGLDGGRNLNLRRIERYLTLAWSSGVTPVIVLNKMDLCQDVNSYVHSVEDIAPGIAVHTVSARNTTGLGILKKYLTKDNTVAFLGSSGVGKSSIINSLLGAEKQEVREVREDDRMGRHTTTRRELIMLPHGGIVIDTPGMRELQMWAGEEDLQGAFQEIETLAKMCRFRDCGHNLESGCEVKAAIARGELDPARLESYHKLQKEVNYLALREEQGARLYNKQKWKKIAKWSKDLKKMS